MTEIKTDEQFKTRLYPDDIEQFREQAKELNITQKELFNQYRQAFQRLRVEVENKEYSTDLRTVRAKTDEIIDMFQSLVIRTSEEIVKAKVDENEHNKTIAKLVQVQEQHKEEMEQKEQKIKELQKQLVDKIKIADAAEKENAELKSLRDENQTLVFRLQELEQVQNELAQEKAARQNELLEHRNQLFEARQELQAKYDEKIEKYQSRYEETLKDFRVVVDEKIALEKQVQELKQAHQNDIEELKKKYQKDLEMALKQKEKEYQTAHQKTLNENTKFKNEVLVLKSKNDELKQQISELKKETKK